MKEHKQIPDPGDGAPWYLRWWIALVNSGYRLLAAALIVLPLGGGIFYVKRDAILGGDTIEPPAPIRPDAKPWLILNILDGEKYTLDRYMAVNAELDRLRRSASADQALLRVYNGQDRLTAKLAAETRSQRPGILPIPEHAWIVSITAPGYSQAQEKFNRGECMIRSLENIPVDSALYANLNAAGIQNILSCAYPGNEYGYISISWGLGRTPADIASYENEIRQSLKRIGEIMGWG